MKVKFKRISAEFNRIMLGQIEEVYRCYDSGDKNKVDELFPKFMKRVHHICAIMSAKNTNSRQLDDQLLSDMTILMWEKVITGYKRFDSKITNNCSGWVGGIYWCLFRNYMRKHNKATIESQFSTHSENTFDESPLSMIEDKRNFNRVELVEVYKSLKKSDRIIVRSILKGEKSFQRAQRLGVSNSSQSIADNRLREKLKSMMILK